MTKKVIPLQKIFLKMKRKGLLSVFALFGIVSTMTTITNIEIFDVFGRTCNVSRVTCNENEMDISFLPAGIYFIRIQTETGTVTKKVITN